MTIEKERPTRTVDNKETTETHPAFGQVGISFVSSSGKQAFYGSALPGHDRYVMLRVGESKRLTSSSGDVRYHSPGMGGSILEIKLTGSQFAELLTTPNVGSGVPCTIATREGKAVPEIDDSEMFTETKAVVNGFEESQRKAVEHLRALSAELQAALKGPVSKKKAEALIDHVDAAIRETQSNQPYALVRFQEATDKISTQAKGEVDTFFVHAIRQLGLKALRESDELLPDPNARLRGREADYILPQDTTQRRRKS